MEYVPNEAYKLTSGFAAPLDSSQAVRSAAKAALEKIRGAGAD
jgi:hypothetical protein